VSRLEESPDLGEYPVHGSPEQIPTVLVPEGRQGYARATAQVSLLDADPSDQVQVVRKSAPPLNIAVWLLSEHHRELYLDATAGPNGE
jgi:hypothetical protein